MATACVMDASFDDKALNGLLDAFGAAFSLEEIASVYCQAGKDADLAAELLDNSDGYSSSSVTCGSSSETRSVDSLDGSFVMVRNSKSSPVNGSMKQTKQIWRPVSTGTVSGRLGKDYVSSKPLINGVSCMTKPKKVEPRPSPTTYGYEKENSRIKEMVDFLFGLLGVGFKLHRSQIRTVLGQCGYDINKSMQELLYISAENSAKNCSYTNGSARKVQPSSSRNSLYTQSRRSGPTRSTRNGEVAAVCNETEPSEAFRSKIDRELEVLAALFTSEKPTELSGRSRAVADSVSSKSAWEIVDFPDGSNVDSESDSLGSEKNADADAEHEADSYQVLRRAVKEYMSTKKEYYRAAVEAHAEGNHTQAAKFLEQGEFFHRKAQQADEESVLKIFDIRPNEKKTGDTFTLDLHEHGPKDATRLLKCHLPMLSAFNYLKLIINTQEKDIAKGSRKRKIMKLLEEHSIQWIKGSQAGTIFISANEIDPESLPESGTPS